MTAYMLLAIFPVILGFCFPGMEENRKKKITYFVICGAVMLFVMGCRHYSLGSTDTYYYCYRMNQAISCHSWKEFYAPDSYEAGFQLFVFLLSRVFKHYQWILVITSLFYIISFFYFIDRNSDNTPLSITLFVTLGLMSFLLQGMRQALAMCMCLFAYEQAKQRHCIRFLLIVLLATTIHQTAVIFLGVYWLPRLKLTKGIVFWFSVFAVIGIVFSMPLINLANKIWGKEYSGTVESGGYIATAIYFVALAVCYFYYRSHKEDTRSVLVFVMIIGAATYIMRYTGVLIAERISFYFMFSQIALLPSAIKLVKPRQRLAAYLAIMVLAVGLYAYRLNGPDFLPYAFFWQ